MPAQQKKITVEEALHIGWEHYNAQRLPEAESVCTQILDQFPDQHVALHMLGLIAHQVGKHETAVDLINKSLRVMPDYVDALNNLGIALQALGRQQEAITKFLKALDINPNFPAAQNNLGVANYQLGNIQEAVSRYQNAILINTDYFDAYQNLGVALAFSGKLKESINAYYKALKLKPNHPEILYNLAEVLRRSGDFELAIDTFKLALAAKPDYAEAHNNLGNTLRDNEQRVEAIDSYKSALAAAPDYTMAQHNIGTTLQELGKTEEAVASLEQIDTALSRPALLECVYTLANKSRFYRELKRITKENPTNVGVAAVSAFASHQFDCEDPYPFCKNPLDFVQIKNLLASDTVDHKFLNILIEDLFNLNLGGVSQSLLASGVQSPGTLFVEPKGSIADFVAILEQEIDNYFLCYNEKDCLFVTKKPKQYKLQGWYITMSKGGFLKPHNHPSGWLSGVFYLKIPSKNGQDGDIEFGLHGKDLPILNNQYPKQVPSLAEGDLAMFPSSLFHRTLPFYSDEDRLCVAFDLAPKDT